jgi:AraC-like DNA-binding protein
MNTEDLIIFSEVIISAFFILYFLLFKRIQKEGRKYILAGMAFAFYLSFYEFIYALHYQDLAIWLFIFYYPAMLSFYPIIYHFLVYAIKDKNERLIVKIFSFLPLVAIAVILILYLPLDFSSKISFIQADFNSFGNSAPNYSILQIIVYALYYLQLIIFIVIFFQMYFIQRQKKKQKNSNDLFLPDWLFLCITVIVSYEILYLAAIILNLDGYENIIFNVANFIMLLFLGFLGIYHDDMKIKMILDKDKNEENILKPGMKDNDIFNEDYHRIIESIQNIIIDKKLYENPGLKLEHLAKKLHIPVKKLSAVINQQTGNNFSYYLNSFRVEKAKSLMNDKEKNKKIEDVYLQVGYYTRSTFNRAFKSIEGITPTEYIKANS